jgi:hypothetical protein
MEVMSFPSRFCALSVVEVIAEVLHPVIGMKLVGVGGVFLLLWGGVCPHGCVVAPVVAVGGLFGLFCCCFVVVVGRFAACCCR